MPKAIALIHLEYSKIFASLISSIIASQLNENNNLQIDFFSEYLPLQIAQKTLNNIIEYKEYYTYIITEKSINIISNFNESEIAIALFPLIIYCYKNPQKLEQEIERLNGYKLLSIKQLNSIKILITFIYLILENRLESREITKQISQELDNIDEIKKIKLIEKLIKYKLPLTKVEEELTTKIAASNLGIYQALYSFFSMPDNLEISLQRSNQFSEEKETTIVLTGLLLGLKHGYLGIPYHWRQVIQTHSIFEEIETLSKQLIARWQGKLHN